MQDKPAPTRHQDIEATTGDALKWEIRNIHGKVLVLEFLFNKVANLKDSSYIKRRLQHRCFPVNITKVLRTPILEHLPTTASENLRRIAHDSLCFPKI